MFVHQQDPDPLTALDIDCVGALHGRLLAGYPEAGPEIAAIAYGPLVEYLIAHHPCVDPGAVHDAVADAVVAYLDRPARANGVGGRQVMAHLQLAAWRNILNHRRREGRLKRREQRYAADLGRRRRDSDRRVVALLGSAGKVLEEAIDPGESAEVSAMEPAGWSTEERTVWVLFRAGERRTAEYAAALGITGRPVSDQRVIVKRIKERLRVRVKRGGGRRR